MEAATIKKKSRETSPRTDQTVKGTTTSRETGPHPTKSLKKLAQALKKRAKYDAEQKTPTSSVDHPRKALAAAMKRTAKTPQSNPPTKTLAKTPGQHVEQRNERPT